MTTHAECLHGAETDSDFLWATGFVAPDPLFWFRKGRRSYLLVPPLELGRAQSTARVDHVLDAAVIERRLQRRTGTTPRPLDVVVEALRSKGVEAVDVPDRFPLGTAEALRAAGISVTLRPSPFFPARAVKAPHELAAVERAQRANEFALEAALHVLRAARIRRGELWHGGTRVTSESLRHVIDVELLRHGCIGRHTIVASGEHGVDPHDVGSGPIRAHVPLILDIFPRETATGYFADMTRTVVRGRAGARVREMYAAVEAAQEFAFERIRGGADAQAIHRGILELFTDAGFPTGAVDGRMQGFFHGTGHGVGLDIHEPPSFGARPSTLPEGAVVTVEPGLYYPGVGGVRLEDMVLVTASGCRNLTRARKVLVV